MEQRYQEMFSVLNAKVASSRTKRNYKESPFFRLLGEIRNRIYDLLFSGQTHRIGMANRKFHLLHSAVTNPLDPLKACRQLHYEAKELPYKTSTFTFATFDSVSLFDTWRVAIDWDPNPCLDCLESLPAHSVIKFDVVGIKAGHNRSEQMSKRAVKGYKKAVDYKTKLIEYIYMIYPKAEITFRTAKNYESFLKA
ncbi:hypothetical protein M3J09_002532 [Ascochyta lentis]